MEITRENAKDELYNFRARFNITQEKLSDKTGISRTTIVAIERGYKQPRAATLFKINEYAKTFWGIDG